MVKTYLGFSLKCSLSQITNSKSYAISKDNKYIYLSFNNYILAFNLRTCEQIFSIKLQNSKISCMALRNNILCTGFENGSISIINIDEINNTSNSSYTDLSKKYIYIHQKEINSINFNEKGNLQVTASSDKTICIQDLISDMTLYKLNGHRDRVLQAEFWKYHENYIISISVDYCFKIWDLSLQTCIHTYSDTANKLCTFLTIDNSLIFGTFNKKLLIFDVNINDYIGKKGDILVNKGILNKQTKAKTLEFSREYNNKYFTVLSQDSSIEFFKILSEEEIKARIFKSSTITKEGNTQNIIKNIDKCYNKGKYDSNLKYKSLFKFEQGKNKKNLDENIKDINKITNVFLINAEKFGCLTNHNTVELYSLNDDYLYNNIYELQESIVNDDNKKNETNLIINELKEDNLNIQKLYSIGSIIAHKNIIDIIIYSKDSKKIYSSSKDSIKIWSSTKLIPLKSKSIVNTTSLCILNYMGYLITGNKYGDIIILDLNSLEIRAKYQKIHDGEITSIVQNKNKNSFVSVSEDKSIKFFNINEQLNDKLEPYNEISTLDSISYAIFSNDFKFFAYAMLDNSIKILYTDSMKLHLNLYGHKMPICSFDISSDGLLLVSGSLDKTVKLWGMDFGDCHKTFSGHTDIITCVKFMENTHYFISGSRDKKLRYFDADTLELVSIINNEELCGQLICLDINKEGTQIVTGFDDFSLKVFENNNEQMVAKLNQSKYIEEKLIAQDNNELEKEGKKYMNVFNINRKMDHLSMAESLIESLELCEKFKEQVIQYGMNISDYNKSMKKEKNSIEIYTQNLLGFSIEKPKPSPMFLGKNIFVYLMDEIKTIPNFELENVLNNIPYSYFQKLVYYFEYYIRKNIEVELCARCVIFFGYLYEAQISTDKVINKLINSIYRRLKGRLKLEYNIIKFNTKSIALILNKHKEDTKDIDNKFDL